jgi:5'-nucleotidase
MTRTIITNDDGIDAPGIDALHRAASGLGPLIVVAPEGARSGAGHSVTTKEPLIIDGRRESWYAVHGTPADCARVALTEIAPDAGWLLAGVNRGGNLGADTYTSGTVAAAREATLLGFKAIAISQYVHAGLEVDWEWTSRQAAAVIDFLVGEPLREHAFWNVNLPHLVSGSPDPEMVFCGLDYCPLDVRFEVEDPIGPGRTLVHYLGNYYGRERLRGRDVDVCFGGAIAITEIPLDITTDR